MVNKFTDDDVTDRRRDVDNKEKKTTSTNNQNDDNPSASSQQQQSQQQLPQQMKTTNTATKSTTQVVFVRLDPILQRLLQNVTELRTSYCDADKDDDNNNNNNNEASPLPLSSLYNLIDNIVKDMNELSKHIRSFCDGSVSSPSSFVPTLILLADYVTLPLTAIFHLQLQYKQFVSKANNNKTTTTTITNDTTDTTKSLERQLQIQQTYVRKLYDTTARTIQIYVKSTTTSTITTTKTTNTQRLKSQYLIKYLIALTSALPSYNEVVETHNDNNQTLPIKILATYYFPDVLMIHRHHHRRH